MAQQLVDQGLQFLDLCRQFGHLGVALPGCRDDFANHALQHGGVFWQGVEVDLHAGMMNDTAASLPALFLAATIR